jgi:SAM-dependent methyltransferase
LYDLLYSYRDLRGETKAVVHLIREHHPEAETVLDVGCATGGHAQLLTTDHGYAVDGIDIQAEFVEMASARCPDGHFFEADMADFHLDRRYDVILNLFSSIGYVKTTDRLQAAARCTANHLAPGGVALIEPWFTPERFSAGRLHLHTMEEEDLKVCRVSRSEVMEGVSRMEFQYLVARPGGIQHLKEIHELGLFTDSEMRESLRSAGLEVLHHDGQGIVGDRGLYVARIGTGPGGSGWSSEGRGRTEERREG